MSTPQRKIFSRAALCFCTILGACGAPVAHAQTTTVQAQGDGLSKVPGNVVDLARQGVAQDLFVVLDGKDIQERETAKRISRGLRYNDAQLNEETAREFGALKASVFPGGRLGAATVLSEQTHAPIVLVRVPDLATLVEIASHPKVIGIEANVQFKPTGFRAARAAGS